MFKHLLPGIGLAILALAPFLAQGAPSSTVTVVFDHVLPNVPGKSMRGVLVEYPPGGASAAHTLKPARTDRHIADDPTDGVGYIKRQDRQVARRPFTVDELRSVLAAASPEWKSLIVFGL